MARETDIVKDPDETADRGGPKTASRKGQRRLMASLAVVAIAVVVGLLAVSRPTGATYEKYLKLKEGMRRPEVVAVIGQGDYWHHYEGDKDVTNWVNRDGTYIRAVFDKKDVLVEVSWESGWNPKWQKE